MKRTGKSIYQEIATKKDEITDLNNALSELDDMRGGTAYGLIQAAREKANQELRKLENAEYTQPAPEPGRALFE